MQECLDKGTSTGELAEVLHENLTAVRQELIRLHHLGVIEPIAIRYEKGDPLTKLYFQDYVWSLTRHGLEHNYSVKGCYACALREKILLLTQHLPF